MWKGFAGGCKYVDISLCPSWWTTGQTHKYSPFLLHRAVSAGFADKDTTHVRIWPRNIVFNKRWHSCILYTKRAYTSHVTACLGRITKDLFALVMKTMKWLNSATVHNVYRHISHRVFSQFNPTCKNLNGPTQKCLLLMGQEDDCVEHDRCYGRDGLL